MIEWYVFGWTFIVILVTVIVGCIALERWS
jgi:hypothetical protein